MTVLRDEVVIMSQKIPASKDLGDLPDFICTIEWVPRIRHGTLSCIVYALRETKILPYSRDLGALFNYM